jgi:DNA-binding NtrC family response regulator
VQGIKDGAADFITKPWSNHQLLQSVQTTLDLAGANREVTPVSSVSRQDLDIAYDFEGILGDHPSFLRALEVTGRVAATDASVLITGESGTGKELIAEAIHRNSRRNQGPFVKVNLGGISSTLFESEMFGHVKGAFTDARETRKGRFELANGGTIFLDEIGDLDVNSQVKMLRVLQDRTYEVLGSSTTRSLDIRVISATNRDLPEMVTTGEFREDLLYRLNLIVVHLPPLRERLADIDLLASHFAETIGTVYRRPSLKLTDQASQYLGEMKWPGNVRQLRQVIERAVLVASGDSLDLQDFVLAAEMEPGGQLEESLPSPGSMTLDEIEKAMIVKCLKAYRGNISKVAEALGTSRGALYRRLEKHGLKP